MLYTKSDYQTADLNEVYDLVDALTLGTLVTAHEGGVAISHPIFMTDRNRGDNGTLISHLAAANEHVELLRRGLPTVAFGEQKARAGVEVTDGAVKILWES